MASRWRPSAAIIAFLSPCTDPSKWSIASRSKSARIGLPSASAAISTIYKLYQKPGEPKLPKGIYSPRLQKLFDAENAPIEEIVGPTGDSALTLITCGGQFDYSNGHYISRTVVRCTFSEKLAASS